MSTSAEYPHIILNDNQVPHIGGTTMKFVELVMAQRANGWSQKS